MSWEGYQQNLCANGHSFDDEEAPFNFGEEEAEYPTCHCGAACVWWNLVDTTNGSFNVDSEGNETAERIDGYVELEILTPAEECSCSSCGNRHVKKEATYKIPEGVGHRV